jgi:hypothetical protein
MPMPSTRCFSDVFVEHLILRTLPLLADSSRKNIPVSLVVSPATIAAFARRDWLSIIDEAEKKCMPGGPLVVERLGLARQALAQHDGSVIEFFKSLVNQSCLRLIARPFEGVDLSCWISHPGLLNFQFQSIQRVYEAYFGCRATEISLLGSGYAPHLDAGLNDAGFTIAYVDSEAVLGAQSKLTFGVHRPVLDPTNGIALCPVDTEVLAAIRRGASSSRSHWLNTDTAAILKDSASGLSSECYPDETGLVRSYDAHRALGAFAEGLETATRPLKRKLASASFRKAQTLTTIWSPTGDTLWWEELELSAGLHGLSLTNGWHLIHAENYLETNPEQDTAWLGTVLSHHSEETSHLWLPRRVVSIFERFRAASMAQEHDANMERFETVARLLLFSKVQMGVYYPGSGLDFLANQTSASILSAAEHLLNTDGGCERPPEHSISNWANEVSLVSASRG